MRDILKVESGCREYKALVRHLLLKADKDRTYHDPGVYFETLYIFQNKTVGT